MANDHNSGSPTTSSPRISFSYHFSQSDDTVPVEQLFRSCSSSGVDFNFCVQAENCLHHASMADELFSNGKILPSPIIPLVSKQLVGSEAVISTRQDTRPPSPHFPGNEKSRSLPPEDREVKQQNLKSFWGFKRSSSCGSGYGRSLCPIALLSRSHSSGSSNGSKQSSSSSNEGFDRKYNRNLRKPALRKSGYGNIISSNVIRVNPVLNLGFGPFFTSSGKHNLQVTRSLKMEVCTSGLVV